jgi:RNase P subunit RPR2
MTLKDHFMLCSKCSSFVKIGLNDISKKAKLVKMCPKCGHIEKY